MSIVLTVRLFSHISKYSDTHDRNQQFATAIKSYSIKHQHLQKGAMCIENISVQKLLKGISMHTHLPGCVLARHEQ
jgi:hypothetical protein